jgi:hypothetical protein
MAGDWGESGEGVDDPLTRAIIDAIIKVHKVLGPGFGRSNLSAADHPKGDDRRVVSPPSPIIPPISLSFDVAPDLGEAGWSKGLGIGVPLGGQALLHPFRHAASQDHSFRYVQSFLSPRSGHRGPGVGKA